MLKEFCAACTLPSSPYHACYTPDAFRDTVLTPVTIQLRLVTMAIFVAVTSAGEIVGTIGCSAVSTQEGHIRGKGVIPECQGGGVAAPLLAAAECELRTQGCRRITLDTTEPLERAVGFYERHGCRRSGKISDFFGMPLLEYVKPLA